MKKLILIFLSSILLSCQSETKTGTTKVRSEDTVVRAADFNQAYFYKRLEGTIAGQPVVIHLVKNKDHITGSYYYSKTGGFIALEGKHESDKLLLTEYAENGQSAGMTLSFSTGRIEGNWVSGDQKKTHPIFLQELYPDGSYPLTYQQQEDDYKPYPDKKDGPAATISLSYLLSANGNELIDQHVKRMLSIPDSLAHLSVEEGVNRVIRDYFVSYKRDIRDREEMGMDMNSPANTFEHIMGMMAPYNDNGYLVLESSYYDYSGGAHPNHGTSYIALDVKNGKRLRFSDIVDADSATIAPIMEEYFRKGNGNITAGQPLSQVLFQSYILPNENFYFNKRGIGFWYNPYEIAAYAYGDTELFIPFERLKAYLTPEFRMRMKLEQK